MDSLWVKVNLHCEHNIKGILNFHLGDKLQSKISFFLDLLVNTLKSDITNVLYSLNLHMYVDSLGISS